VHMCTVYVYMYIEVCFPEPDLELLLSPFSGPICGLVGLFSGFHFHA
jgi:hypothetical protein